MPFFFISQVGSVIEIKNIQHDRNELSKSCYVKTKSLQKIFCSLSSWEKEEQNFHDKVQQRDRI